MFGFRKPGRNALRAALLAGAAVAAIGAGGVGSASAAVETCEGVEAIKGTGSTLQTIAQEEWGKAFPGSITCPEGLKAAEVSYVPTGSGAGLAEWNSKGGGAVNTGFDFIGTDDPPTATQYTNITNGTANHAGVVLVPVTQTAIAVTAHPPTNCTVTNITNADLEKVFSGTLGNWNELHEHVEDVGGACNSPIKRVVREDESGTTYQFKHYLFTLNGANLDCSQSTRNWQQLQTVGANPGNLSWPETEGGCSLTEVLRAKGGGGVAATVAADSGTIGYAALPDAKAKGAQVLDVQNNGTSTTGANFANPAIEANGNKDANCENAVYDVPAVGTEANWTTVYGSNHEIGGTTYPICTLTYVLVFENYLEAEFEEGVGGSVADYVSDFLVQNAGQNTLTAAKAYYAKLPTGGLATNDVLATAQSLAALIVRN